VFLKFLNTVSFETRAIQPEEVGFLLWSFGDWNYSSGKSVKRQCIYELGDFEVEKLW